MAIVYDTDESSWILAVMLLAGLGTTVLYRPGLVDVLRRLRGPTLAETCLVALNGVAGLMLLAAVVTLLSPPTPPTPSDPDYILRLLHWPVLIAALVLPTLPIVVQIVRNFASRERRAPVSAAFVGMAGGGLASFVTVVLIRASIESLISNPVQDVDRLMTPAGLGVAGLLFGFGVANWKRALLAGDAPHFDGAASFRSGLLFAILLLGLGVAACVHVLLQHPTRGTTDVPDFGLIWAAGLTAGLGLIWMLTLLRLWRTAARSNARSVLATVLLACALAWTLLLVSSLGTAGDWAGLALIFFVPLTVVMAVIVAVPVPWLLKRVLARTKGAV